MNAADIVVTMKVDFSLVRALRLGNAFSIITVSSCLRIRDNVIGTFRVLVSNIKPLEQKICESIFSHRRFNSFQKKNY